MRWSKRCDCRSARPRARRLGRAVKTMAAVSALLALVATDAGAVKLTQLTFTGRDENWGSWAPDGRSVLFSSGEVICGRGQWFCGPQNIWSMRFEGAEVLSLNLLVSEAYHPRISPDGKWAACMRHNGNDWDLYVWPIGDWAAGHVFQSLQGFQERFPNWSNDSRFIAFDSDRPSELQTTGYQVYYAPLDQPDDPSAAVQVTFLGSNNKHPTWNADDSELAYVGDAQDRRSISAVRLDDGRYRLITPHRSQNRHPDWSPDGKWIAFTTDRWDDIGDIAIVRADGQGVPIRVTVGMNGHDDFAEWSHDSQRLIFCGTAIAPPYQPNKEIFVASQLPFGEAVVAVSPASFGSLKAGFRSGH